MSRLIKLISVLSLLNKSMTIWLPGVVPKPLIVFCFILPKIVPITIMNHLNKIFNVKDNIIQEQYKYSILVKKINRMQLEMKAKTLHFRKCIKSSHVSLPTTVNMEM